MIRPLLYQRADHALIRLNLSAEFGSTQVGILFSELDESRNAPRAYAPRRSCRRLFTVVRSPGDNQRRSLCLTEDVLEHTDALGSSSFLRLSDVIGARAESMAATRRDGHDQATHRLQVYAYIRWEQGAGKGCMGR